MEITARIPLPDYVYRFYAQASRCIHNHTPEEVMADALTAYAGMLSRDIAHQQKQLPEKEESP